MATGSGARGTVNKLLAGPETWSKTMARKLRSAEKLVGKTCVRCVTDSSASDRKPEGSNVVRSRESCQSVT